MTSSWKDSEAEQLVKQASRHEDVVPAHAQARVWNAVHRAERRAFGRPLWPVFLAGAALTAALILFLRPHDPTEPHAKIAVGARLPAEAKPAFVELHGVADVVTGPNAVVTVDRYDDHDVDLHVDSGTVLFHVLPRAGRGPFIVHTPGFVARVVGTVFRITVDADRTSRIAVANGAVEVTPIARPTQLVRAHQSWPDNATLAPSAEELALLPTHVSSADFLPITPHVCVGDAESRVRCELAFARDASPSEAENALYRAGLVAWRELGDPQRALTVWRQQRERFPNGALRREVQASMIDALVATRSLHEAETAIESYLAVEPEDLRAPELHFVLGTIERRLDGSCRRAVAELDLALAHPSGTWVQEARDARRACSRSR